MAGWSQPVTQDAPRGLGPASLTTGSLLRNDGYRGLSNVSEVRGQNRAAATLASDWLRRDSGSIESATRGHRKLWACQRELEAFT